MIEWDDSIAHTGVRTGFTETHWFHIGTRPLGRGLVDLSIFKKNSDGELEPSERIENITMMDAIHHVETNFG